jgi:Flp pilus assembly protein TadG
MAIMFSLATVMVFFVIQVALLFHARSVVSAAAQDGVRAAQVENATASDAHDAASQILSGSTGLLNNESVVVTPSGEFVTVTVTADVTPVVFGLTGPVTASASGVIERFRPQSER